MNELHNLLREQQVPKFIRSRDYRKARNLAIGRAVMFMSAPVILVVIVLAMTVLAKVVR